MIEHKIIKTETRKEFGDYVIRLIKDGYVWLNGDAEITSEPWNMYEENTAITIHENSKKFGYIRI